MKALKLDAINLDLHVAGPIAERPKPVKALKRILDLLALLGERIAERPKPVKALKPHGVLVLEQIFALIAERPKPVKALKRTRYRCSYSRAPADSRETKACEGTETLEVDIAHLAQNDQ